MVNNISEKDYEIFLFNNKLELNNLRYDRFFNFVNVNLELFKLIDIFDCNNYLKKIFYNHFKKHGYGHGYLNSSALNKNIFKNKIDFHYKYLELNRYIDGCEVGYDITYNKSSIFINLKIMDTYFIYNDETYYFESSSEKENLLKNVFINKYNFLILINFLEICFSYGKHLRKKDLNVFDYEIILKSYFNLLSEMNIDIKSIFRNF